MKKKLTEEEKLDKEASEHASRKVVSNHYDEYLNILEKKIASLTKLSQSHGKVTE